MVTLFLFFDRVQGGGSVNRKTVWITCGKTGTLRVVDPPQTVTGGVPRLSGGGDSDKRFSLCVVLCRGFGGGVDKFVDKVVYVCVHTRLFVCRVSVC
jgi:hypothetical protein